MKIKEISKKDIPKLANLEKRVFKENAFSKDLLRKLMKYSLLFYKLIKDNSLIGFVIIVEDNNKQANLANFLINPDDQGKGFGKFFLKKTLEMFREKYPKYDKIVLNVQISNEPALNLYSHFNFKIKKKIPFYYRSGESSYLMELDFEETTLKNNYTNKS